MPRVIIAGFGYLGAATGRVFFDAGWDVLGLTHSADSAERLNTPSIPVLACDISDRKLVESTLRPFAAIETVVDCVSSGKGGAESYRKNYLEGARHLIGLLQPRRFVFTSSTSVYAQTDGSLVDEQSPAAPTRETGRILRETERFVLAHEGTVARLGAIYGPGRSILLRRFFDGTARIERDGQRLLNQIHRDDAARALFLLATHQESLRTIVNVTDNSPMTQAECFQWLAARFDKPLPPTGEVELNRKRGWTNKRVSNARLRGLGWSCGYPSFADAIVRDERLVGALNP